MAMALRAAATTRVCAALLIPPSISAAKRQEARIIGAGNRRGAVWRIATNSCSRILCTRSSSIDSSIKKEESNAVEALALDLAKQAKALDSLFLFFFFFVRVFFSSSPLSSSSASSSSGCQECKCNKRLTTGVPELFLLQWQAGALILEKSGHALQVGLQSQFSKKKKKVLTKFVHCSLFTITTSESRNGKFILWRKS